MFLTYVGGAKDHDVTPEILKKGTDGKPIKRNVVKPAVVEFTELKTYSLWGIDFPKGEAVEIPGHINAKAISKKALALGCFQVGAMKAEEMASPLAEAVAEDEAALEDKPKKRGRPRKAKE